MSFKEFATGFKSGFQGFGHFVSDVVNFVLLTFVWLIGIGPASVLGKFTGKKFLDMELVMRESYWVAYVVKTEPLESYEKQY
ncbi:MAG: hypothetical protein HYS81_03930 [Candidatus Aenigmatarchaeota archaeon]|nr:MAG: hypothetical protein HYS81_03930 [Candidatus Aenigmarchaeota archaeon]